MTKGSREESAVPETRVILRMQASTGNPEEEGDGLM